MVIVFFYFVSYSIVVPVILVGFFFFFKQKTAYEMRISDWSSDVCSSDLSREATPKEKGSKSAVSRNMLHFRLAVGGKVIEGLSTSKEAARTKDRKSVV